MVSVMDGFLGPKGRVGHPDLTHFIGQNPAGVASTRRMNEYMPPVQPGRSPRRNPASGGTSTGMPSLAICCIWRWCQ
jgi:hypothetical protein